MIPTNEDADVIRFLMSHSAHVNAVIHARGHTQLDNRDDEHDAWVMASLAHDVGLQYSPPMGTRDFMLIRAIGPECWGMMDTLESHWWDEYV